MTEEKNVTWPLLRSALIRKNRTSGPAEWIKHPNAPPAMTDKRLSSFMRKGAPKFDELPWLSELLGEDPAFLAREMGMIPKVPSEMLQHQIQLASAITTSRATLARIQADMHAMNSAVASMLVDKVISSGKWAVATWPSAEGPSDCRLRVAVRLDFRRVDGGPETAEALKEDFGDDLAKIGAVRSAAQPRWQPGHPYDLSWSIQSATASRGPWSPIAHPKILHFCVAGHTTSSWASDVAAIVSMLSGYALESTRSLKLTYFSGARRESEGDKAADDVAAARERVQGILLKQPLPHTVWYHFGRASDPKAPFIPEPGHGEWPRGLFFIRLRETDEAIDAAFPQDPKRRSEARHGRVRIDKVAAKISEDNLLELPVYEPTTPDGRSFDELERRNIKMAACVDQAVTAMEVLLDRKLLAHSSLQHRLDEMSLPTASHNEQVLSNWIVKHKRMVYRE
jgi:hypothetical protein